MQVLNLHVGEVLVSAPKLLMKTFNEIAQGWEHLSFDVELLLRVEVGVFFLLSSSRSRCLHSVCFLQRLDEDGLLDHSVELVDSCVCFEPVDSRENALLGGLQERAHQEHKHLHLQADLQQVIVFVLELVCDPSEHLHVEVQGVLAFEALLLENLKTLLNISDHSVVNRQIVA